MKFQLEDQEVAADEQSYIAPNAILIGAVSLGKKASVWFNAVIRADNDRIDIGDGSNIQDCSVLHVDEGSPITIGRNVTIGHHVTLHGCEIGDGTLIGINAVVLNGAKIGQGCLIGANTLITENTVIPDHSMVLGSPGKIVKLLDQATIEKLQKSAESYQLKIPLYRNGLREQIN